MRRVRRKDPMELKLEGNTVKSNVRNLHRMTEAFEYPLGLEYNRLLTSALVSTLLV